MVPPNGDPETVIALIHRILDDHQRTIRAIAVVAAIGGFFTQVIGSSIAPGIPTGVIGASIGILCVIAPRLAARLRCRRSTRDDPTEGSTRDDQTPPTGQPSA
jgi:hypothetical protein